MPRLAIGVAAISIAAVAGCSSSGSSPAATPSPSISAAVSGPAYALALNAIKVSEDRAHHQVEAAFHAKTVAQIRGLLTAFADAQATDSHRLGALSPPADALTANAQLANAFGANANAIRTLVSKLATVTSVKRALHIINSDQAAQSTGKQIDAALKALKKLGYTELH